MVEIKWKKRQANVYDSTKYSFSLILIIVYSWIQKLQVSNLGTLKTVENHNLGIYTPKKKQNNGEI